MKAYVGLGSNLNHPWEQIKSAKKALQKLPETTLLRFSDLYQTRPWDNLPQPDFINACCVLETTLTPEALLQGLLDIETAHGRVRPAPQNASRILDLDLLLYDCAQIETEFLTLPHPRMLERAFVLVPLSQVEPQLVLPNGKIISEFLENMSLEGIQLYEANRVLTTHF